jgi:hypothetical protein
MVENATDMPELKGDGRKNLDIVYGDIVGRLIKDDENSWNIVTLSGVLLTLLGTLLVQRDSLEFPVWAFALLAGIFLSLAMVTGIISRIVFRDIKSVPFKEIILGCRGADAYARNWEILKNASEASELSFFHTYDIFQRGVSPDAILAYLDEVKDDDKFDKSFVGYLFFLANIIEIKKRPRSLSFLFMLLAGVFIALLLIVPLLPW